MCAAAFYPNYFKTHLNPESSKEIIRQLCGKNPKSTVQVRGLPEPVALNHAKLKTIFEACAPNCILHYDRNRAYVEFRDFYEITNKIASGVYFAMFLSKMLSGEQKLAVPPIVENRYYYEKFYYFLK